MNLSDILGSLDSTPAEESVVSRFRRALFDVIREKHCVQTRARLSVAPEKQQQLVLRCSSLSDVLSGAAIVPASLAEATAVPAPNDIGSQLNFDVGHAIHEWWQNQYLAHMGDDFQLLGNWLCLSCKALAEMTTKPEQCACGASGQAIRYTEIDLYSEELRLYGHPDCVFGPGHPRYLGEIKTIGSDRFDKLSSPVQEHRIQTHAYMKMLGLREVIFVYVDKGKQSLWRKSPSGVFVTFGPPRVKFFHEQFDDLLWARIEAAMQKFWTEFESRCQ